MVLAAVVTAVLCVVCVGIVAVDDDADAAVSGSGTEEDPFIADSGDLVTGVVDLCYEYSDYIGVLGELYFEFESGSAVNITSQVDVIGDMFWPGAETYVVSSDPGSLVSNNASYDDYSIDGSLSGTATEDFSFKILDSEANEVIIFYYSVAQSIDFTSPDAIEAVSKSTISYTAATNIPATFSEVGGTAASWLDIDQTTGQISGTAPDVDAETTYTYEIQATSTEDQSNTATMTLTITVYPALEIGDQFTVGELIYEVTGVGEVEVADTTSTLNSGELAIPSTASDGSTTYSVTSIGDGAFDYCTRLTSVTIPEGVTSIGNSAFRGCSGLTSVTISDGVTSIGDSAFSYCTGLTSVTIPESVTSIGDSAFSRCSGLTSVTIPGSVTSISFHAFSYCTGLTSVTISDGVAIIDSFAFFECTGLTTITIPASVNRIVNSAFFLCSSLTEINVAPSNLDFSSLEGVLFDKDCIDLVLYPRGRQGAYSVPDGTIFISDSAFSGCLGLTSVTIPDDVYSISTGSFWDCSNLTSVTFESATAPFFGTNSFNTGTELNVSTPGWDPTEAMAGAIGNNGTTVIWANPQQVPVGTTFDYDGLRYKITETGLELTGYVTKPTGDLVIPETVPYKDGNFKVTSIGDSAFYSCTELTSVTIPENVTSIGRQAFYNCYSLGSVTFEGTVDSFGESAFQYCSILSQFIFLGDAPTQVGTNAFATNALVYELQTPTYVDTPGWDPFDILTGGKVLMNTRIIWSNPPTFECDGLYYLAISDTEAELYYPPEGTYSGDVTVPQTVMDAEGNQYTVTGIGNYAFYEAENMTSIVLPPTIDKLGYCAFYRAPVSEITFQSAEPPSEMRSSCAEFWGTVDVYTPGWDPEVVLDDYHSMFTNIVWANQSSSDLTFVSDPVADGIIAWISTRT